jgi:hypothetical protein
LTATFVCELWFAVHEGRRRTRTQLTPLPSNILREDWKPVLNLSSVMVGLQYLFLEPNPDDPLNKGA